MIIAALLFYIATCLNYTQKNGSQITYIDPGTAKEINRTHGNLTNVRIINQTEHKANLTEYYRNLIAKIQYQIDDLSITSYKMSVDAYAMLSAADYLQSKSYFISTQIAEMEKQSHTIQDQMMREKDEEKKKKMSKQSDRLMYETRYLQMTAHAYTADRYLKQSQGYGQMYEATLLLLKEDQFVIEMAEYENMLDELKDGQSDNGGNGTDNN
eukprot:TRINITY_DN12419_c0_g1_i1.p1 TRINITY_DN12419_c0_g1~~TRINITY_DN12419_c0_g1_i1.p1  ORF type:complete len:212 (-),score=38.63 TRINITY_DN12419_c0_g1_i1:101-736(-)